MNSFATTLKVEANLCFVTMILPIPFYKLFLKVHIFLLFGTILPSFTRYEDNSYSSQFVLILVNSYSVCGQLVLILLNLVNSYSFWSIRTRFGKFVLIHVAIDRQTDRQTDRTEQIDR